LQDVAQPGTIKIGCMVIAATIKIRRGEAEAAVFRLLETKTLAFKTKEHRHIVPTLIALLEYEWLATKRIIAEDDLVTGICLAKKVDNIFLNSQFDFWLRKARNIESGIKELYEPYKLLKSGEVNEAADFWRRKDCSFEAALMLFEGSEDHKKIALSTFQQLGASAVAEKIKMQMRADGIKKIPRGLRESTKANPAQLTNRELDVLQLLKKSVQNKEIGETLFISPKTVDHHISSILFKLDVNSRMKAVTEAERLGILK